MFKREGSFTGWNVFWVFVGVVGVVYMGIGIKATFDNTAELQRIAREVGQREGIESIVNQAIQLAESCQDIPFVMGDKEIVVANIACPRPAADTPTQ